MAIQEVVVTGIAGPVEVELHPVRASTREGDASELSVATVALRILCGIASNPESWEHAERKLVNDAFSLARAFLEFARQDRAADK